MDEHQISKGFRGAARLLAKRGPQPDFPPFDPAWRTTLPNLVVDAQIMSADGIAEQLSAGGPSWGRRAALGGLGAVAATVLVAVGVLFFRGERPAPVTGEPTFAVIVFAKGPVFRLESGKSVAVRVGNNLRESAVLATEAGGQVDLVLADRSVVRLKENGKLALKRLRREKEGHHNMEVGLTNGRALHLVRRRSARDRYRVITPTAIASVRGTSFRVAQSERETRVLVTEGAVAVTSLHDDAEQAVPEGQEAIVSPPGKTRLTGDTDAATSLREQYAEMLRHADGLDLKALSEIQSKVEIRTEQDLKKVYQKNIELIILEDGRKLRGAVVSMNGGKLIIHTVDGVEVLDMQTIVKVQIVD